MKILFVTPYLPSPPYFGAQRRLDGLMRGLAEQHEVSLLSFNGRSAEHQRSLAVTREYCREVVTVEDDLLNVDQVRKRRMQLRSLVSRRSFEHRSMASAEFQAQLERMVARDRYDVVQIEFAQMGIYRVPRHPKMRVVLDEHNIEYDLARRTAGAAGGLPRKLYNAVNWLKLRREEHAAWRKADGVALTSKRDEEVLQRDVPGTRTAVVLNAVDLEAFRPNDVPRDPATLLFLGAINYYPNTEGVLYFLDHVFPKIVARRPDVKFQIVGMKPPDSVLARKSHNVEVTGFVEDPQPYLDKATAVVVPLRIGGGTRFKIVEAMAKGKAVVSTRIGAEGIEVVHDRHVLFADEPEAFAEQVERLLDDPALAIRLGRAARELAEEKHSWRAAVTVLENFYDELFRLPQRSE